MGITDLWYIIIHYVQVICCDIIISSHGATTWFTRAHYKIHVRRNHFVTVRHCCCCVFVCIFTSIAPSIWTFMSVRVRVWSNFDDAAADNRTERGSTTTTVIAATTVVADRSSLVSQSVGVGWLYAYRSSQSTRSTLYALLLATRRRIIFFLSLALSPLLNTTYSHFFLLWSIF